MLILICLDTIKLPDTDILGSIQKVVTRLCEHGQLVQHATHMLLNNLKLE